MAVLVGGELAAQVHVGLHRVLVLVEAFGRGMPDVDFGARDRLAALVLEPGIDEQRRPGVGERTIEPPFGVTGECMRQNGPSRLASVSAWPLSPLLSRQIELREAERARDQHRLVVGLVGMLAERDDVGHRLAEFLLGQLHLAREVVQVAHEGRHDLAEARVGRALQLRQHRFGDVLLGSR